MLNEFTGASTRTLERRLANLLRELRSFYDDPEAGGGGSPTEGLRERIEDLENELARRQQLQQQKTR